ncbi:MAG: hypothetical protein U1E69_01700 [Tabrizicola sp.]|uniref:hypothetical protein n=1 Tax=Tabrizicola sp. TaxID=2005166 RepID=UPI002AB96202|nr:hypothetical protein [Tabrizicola sp.]MDZ4085495.1 hypothetical protein [Tabrizicola sp.]
MPKARTNRAGFGICGQAPVTQRKYRREFSIELDRMSVLRLLVGTQDDLLNQAAQEICSFGPGAFFIQGFCQV